MLFVLISAMVEDGMGTWLRADPVGRLFAQPARRRDAAASARRRAEFMEDPRACGPCGPSFSYFVQPNTAESRKQLRSKPVTGERAAPPSTYADSLMFLSDARNLRCALGTLGSFREIASQTIRVGP